ncbi:hypothetical protein DL96DRAFT_1702078 [Flagelloscypha sp. PMI_526]|nr:hypothetical protein DL96DRAFT_1702078 [Flagelloscypha sp. PMI_526]
MRALFVSLVLPFTAAASFRLCVDFPRSNRDPHFNFAASSAQTLGKYRYATADEAQHILVSCPSTPSAEQCLETTDEGEIVVGLCPYSHEYNGDVFIQTAQNVSNCLTASNNTNGARVVVRPCDVNELGQRWKIDIPFVRVFGSKCLEHLGAKVYIWDCVDMFPGTGEGTARFKTQESEDVGVEQRAAEELEPGESSSTSSSAQKGEREPAG